MIVTAKNLCERARKSSVAVGAFNTSTLEATKAILEAAEELGVPVIIETSERESQYLGSKVFADTVRDMVSTMSVDVAINLDHGKSFETLHGAIESGYSSVHFDGSKLEYVQNVDVCKKVVQFAHENNISVEGEFNDIGGGSAIHTQVAQMAPLTDPKEAIKFIEETGVDIFAGSYGNIHGIFEGEPKLDIKLIEEIASKTDVCLSLHGGSGIPDEQIRAAIEAGISKINVNTELRVAYRESLDRALDEHSGEVVPYELLPEVVEEIKKVVIEKIKLFGFVK